jgi:ABC-type uncharacterized transport system ATPase subunit
MAQLMIGAELRTLVRREGGRLGDVRLAVDGLDLPAEEAHGVDLKRVGFEVRGGEILGIAGVAGNGQNELMLALSGERTAPMGHAVRIDGKPAGHLNAAQRRALGLCCVPEERNGHAAVPEMTLVENAVLSGYRRMGFLAGGLLRLRKARDYAAKVVRDFDVRTPGVDALARSLSGGNLQKFVVGREVLQNPGVLVVSQPTWGVDAGAAAAIHQALFNLVQAGAAVLVISQDLDELLTITDRLAVINVGVLSGSLATATASLDEVGLLMGGLHGMDEQGTPHEGKLAHVA